jgi:hypothetical protein
VEGIVTGNPIGKGVAGTGFRPTLLTTLFAKKTWNYGWMAIGILLAIDAMVRGVTFVFDIMLPVISNDPRMGPRQR